VKNISGLGILFNLVKLEEAVHVLPLDTNNPSSEE